MRKVTCKENDHRVDRDDCILVPRKTGGSYNRAARYIETLICLECAGRLLEEREAQPASGYMTVNRWGKTSLRYSYEREMKARTSA